MKPRCNDRNVFLSAAEMQLNDTSKGYVQVYFFQQIPLFVEIKAKTGKDQSKERHQDGDSHRAAVGTKLGGWRVLTLRHIQTCDKPGNTLSSK